MLVLIQQCSTASRLRMLRRDIPIQPRSMISYHGLVVRVPRLSGAEIVDIHWSVRDVLNTLTGPVMIRIKYVTL